MPCTSSIGKKHAWQEQEGEVGKQGGMERHATEEETKEEHGGRGRRMDVRTMKEGVCDRIQERDKMGQKPRARRNNATEKGPS